MRETKNLLLTVFLLLGAASGVGQPFTVATLNVDGLPETILGIPLNGDGPGASGTKRASRYLADKGYDIIGVQEDFYYDDELRSALDDDYDHGEWQGFKVGGLPWLHLDGLKFDTDGLCEFWKRKHQCLSEDNVTWNDAYGRTDHANDDLCTKGFRRVEMRLASGRLIVVYNMHMDASEQKDEESGADWHDKEARWSQWRQLRDHVLQHLDNRPIILVGDMNSYYTRDSILSLFIRPIEATGRYLVRDCWVEHSRQGSYPTIGDAPLVPWQIGYQQGEMLDKILYIIPATGPRIELLDYRVETDYTWDDGTPLGDHRPVMARFRYVEKGDANGDGVIDGADVACIARHLVGLTPAAFSPWAADANSDGHIDITDVTRVVRRLHGFSYPPK